MKYSKIAVALPLLGMLSAVQPSVAPARTKTVLKYGAIALGASYLYNLGQRNAYRQAGYYNYGPSYGYSAGYSYCRPQYSFHYSYYR